MLRLLRNNRDIRLLFIAQVVSYLGDWFTFVALAGLVQDLTDSKFLVSVVMVSFTFPSFLMSPIAGPVSDRFDRRKILVVVSFAQAAAALGLLTVDTGRVWTAFLFQGLIAALASFVGPSTSASIPNLVDSEEDLRIANAINALMIARCVDTAPFGLPVVPDVYRIVASSSGPICGWQTKAECKEQTKSTEPMCSSPVGVSKQRLLRAGNKRRAQ